MPDPAAPNPRTFAGADLALGTSPNYCAPGARLAALGGRTFHELEIKSTPADRVARLRDWFEEISGGRAPTLIGVDLASGRMLTVAWPLGRRE